MVKGFQKMYLTILKKQVSKELDERWDILTGLGSYTNKFISWAAKERCCYEADLDDEYERFQISVMYRRLAHVDLEKWKEISKIVFERDSYTCKYCGIAGGTLEIDHIQPISKGGSEALDNLATSCRRCNRQKKDKTLEEFNQWRELNG